MKTAGMQVKEERQTSHRMWEVVPVDYDHCTEIRDIATYLILYIKAAVHLCIHWIEP